MTTALDLRPELDRCDPATRVTRSLLGYGVLAGPFYVVVSLVQALTRNGFDLSRHEWSLLSNGELGWIQVTNFILTGLMVMAASVGLRRALRRGPGSRWAPRLIGAYGLSLVAAGALRADPAPGFPAGVPTAAIGWHGIGHLIAGALGFACVIAACFVLARRFRTEHRGGWALWSTITGIVVVAGFLAIASVPGYVAVNLAFTAATVLVWAWLSTLSVHLYRTVIN